MKEIQLSQGKVALVDDEDYEWLSQWKWSASRYEHIFYAQHRSKGLMHRLITGAKKNEFVDHINRDGLDNRRQNIRICTLAENNRNRINKQPSKSGYRGVKQRGHRYEASIKFNNKAIYLGAFKNPEDAAKAYDEAAIFYHGKFAILNYP
jgi:hypothetical protein